MKNYGRRLKNLVIGIAIMGLMFMVSLNGLSVIFRNAMETIAK